MRTLHLGIIDNNLHFQGFKIFGPLTNKMIPLYLKINCMVELVFGMMSKEVAYQCKEWVSSLGKHKHKIASFGELLWSTFCLLFYVVDVTYDNKVQKFVLQCGWKLMSYVP